MWNPIKKTGYFKQIFSSLVFLEHEESSTCNQILSSLMLLQWKLKDEESSTTHQRENQQITQIFSTVNKCNKK